MAYPASLPVRGPVAPVSFALGALAGLAEFARPTAFRRLKPVIRQLARVAPCAGRFVDGYDLMADLSARFAR